ncbi:MAG TPA: hypothetical protein PKA20_01715 [Burkholderiaceae bacterium]|nr:hypothetical protein [Burkholderiaceae bacterium]
MNILVLLAGVADPKWPLPASCDGDALAAHRAAHPLLSPFDEAALELALKWRDAVPDVRVDALVGAASAQDPLLRHVAGFRLDAVAGLDLARHPAWDAVALAAALAQWVGVQPQRPDLVLIGREFGDDDDGCLPGIVAERLGLPMLGQVLALGPADAGVVALRQHDGGLERRHCALPLLAAVTNHTGNRLRHPLLKNVMNARRMSFAMAALPDASAIAGEAARGVLAATAPAPAPARARACRMLDGDVAAQADALAELLIAEAAR